MRQLDLFGSLSETAPEEKKPAEEEAVAKKEDRFAAPISPAFSKNRLSSERFAAEAKSKLETPVKSGTEEKEMEVETASTSDLFLSLFNHSDERLEEFPEQIVEAPQTLITVTVVEEAIDETEPAVLMIPTQPVILLVHDESKPATEITVPEPEVKLKKESTKSKQKNSKAPELQRNGAVVFDDGKITVKIKNKSPFPTPIVKVTKEKIKKLPQKRGRKSFKEIDAELDLIDIPEDEILFKKQYYPISEVARWFRVNTSLLRFWENEFDVLKPRKNRKGDRLFRPEDVKNLQLIYQLLRQRKYTIEGAKEYIKTNKKKADIQLQLTNTLQKFKSFLLDMKANLQP